MVMGGSTILFDEEFKSGIRFFIKTKLVVQ